MIAWVEGRILSRGVDHVVVDAGGVGYHVFVARQPAGDDVALHTHHEVRADEQRLFGFESREELTLFEMLIGVSNVGPKAALSLLSVAGPAELAVALAEGDIAALAKAPGVGKKTAERLIVELRSKARGLQRAAAPGLAAPVEDDAMAALVALGYTHAQAARALRDVPPEGSTADRVQAALRGMAR